MKRSFLLAAAFALLQGTAAAAPRVWTGGNGDGDWFQPANWDPFGIPAPGDDVVIDMSTTVSLGEGLAAPPIGSLTLGDPAGTYAPILWLSTGLTANGAGTMSTFHPRSTLLSDTSSQIVFTSLTMAQGSSITYTRPGASGPPPSGSGAFINLRVTDTLVVQAGATVTAQGLGYASAAGPQPGATAIYGGGGGGHGAAGGLGGANGAGGGAGGQSYDALRLPGDYGSGGGAGTAAPPACSNSPKELSEALLWNRNSIVPSIINTAIVLIHTPRRTATI